MTGSSETTIQSRARIAGVLYLLIIATALFAEGFVRDAMIVPGDAPATAAKVLQSQTLFRLGLAADLVNCVLDVVVAVLLYALFAPVSRHQSLLAAVLRIAADTILGAVGLLQLSAVALLSSHQSMSSFSRPQIESLASFALNMHGLGYTISIVFFGVGCGVLGGLVFRSLYLPKFIGALLMVAGGCYVFYSFAAIIAPQLSATLYPWLLLPGFISELTLCIWLIVKGVDVNDLGVRR